MIMVLNYIILTIFLLQCSIYLLLYTMLHLFYSLSIFKLLLYTNYHPRSLGYRAALPLCLPMFFSLVLGPPARGLPGAAVRPVIAPFGEGAP